MIIYFAGEPYNHDEPILIKLGITKRLYSFFTKAYILLAIDKLKKNGFI